MIPRLAAPAAECRLLENLPDAGLAAWRGATVFVWSTDSEFARRLLAGGEVEAYESSVDPAAGDVPANLEAEVDTITMFGGAIVVDTLDVVPPDELVDVLRWLHDHLELGAVLAARVPTDLIGKAAGQGRFCAATYLTAYRRAGFAFGQIDRTLLAEDDPVLIEARKRLSFHDPLELRTVGLDALLTRPDRVDLGDLALAENE